MSVAEVFSQIKKLKGQTNSFHSVSVTGGEPLAQPEFCTSLLSRLKSEGLKTYLETNASIINKEAIALSDIISADIKAPEDSGTDESIWTQHRRFLSAAQEKDLFIKMPISLKTSMVSLNKAIDIIKELPSDIPLFFQPVHSLDSAAAKEIEQKLKLFKSLAQKKISKVKIIPQTHKLFFVR